MVEYFNGEQHYTIDNALTFLVNMDKINRVEHLSNYLVIKDKSYYIDSCYTYDCGLETMVFPIEDGKIDWGDIYCAHYTSWDELEENHWRICNNPMLIFKEYKN